MAIYHLSAQVIGRSTGRSSVAAAAYRHGERLVDERTGLTHDYTAKRGVVEVVVMAPSNAPGWVHGPQLWQEVEKVEKRKDAQLAREINLALPVELTHDQRRALLLDYCQAAFVDQGMVADVSIHEPDSNNPHAHVMLTTRSIGPEGFGQKVREWNSKEVLEQWRAGWATHANAALERAGQEARIDHRTIEAQQFAALLDDRMGDAIQLNRSATRHHGNQPASSAHQHNAGVDEEKARAAQQWEQWHAQEVEQQQERARAERRAAQQATPDKPAPTVERDPEEQAWRDRVKARAEQRRHEATTQRLAAEQAQRSAEEARAVFVERADALERAKAQRAKARAKRKDAQQNLARHKKRLTVRLGFRKGETAALAGALAKRKREEQTSRRTRDRAAEECRRARDEHFQRYCEQERAEGVSRAAEQAAHAAELDWAKVESGRYGWEQEQRRRAEAMEQERRERAAGAAKRPTKGLDGPRAPLGPQNAPEPPRRGRGIEPPRPRPPGLSRGR